MTKKQTLNTICQPNFFICSWHFEKRRSQASSLFQIVMTAKNYHWHLVFSIWFYSPADPMKRTQKFKFFKLPEINCNTNNKQQEKRKAWIILQYITVIIFFFQSFSFFRWIEFCLSFGDQQDLWLSENEISWEHLMKYFLWQFQRFQL